MGMKWPGIIVAMVVTLELIIGVGFLITYLHPGNQEIVQVMDDDDSGEESREEGRGGAGEGGGHRRGGMRKQEVETENHGQLECHLLEINEKEDGGEKSSGASLGETFIIAMVLIAAIVFLCIISGCTFMVWRCGFCPERRDRRKRSSSKSSTSTSSGRKRPHDSEESMELGELKRKLQKLEQRSASKEEETVLVEEEIPRKGQRAITEVGRQPEMDDMESASMEEYNRKLDTATKMIKEYEQARVWSICTRRMSSSGQRFGISSRGEVGVWMDVWNEWRCPVCESGDRDLPGEETGLALRMQKSRPGCLHGGGMLGLGKWDCGISIIDIVIVFIA